MTIGTYILLAAIITLTCSVYAYYILTVRSVKDMDKLDRDKSEEK